MKNILIVVAVALLIVSFSFNKKATTVYAGVWKFKADSTIFTLEITQIGTKLSGTHCCTLFGGNKIDCAVEPDEVSITGTASNADSVSVSFKSSFCNKTGRATIKKISPTKIRWIIRKEPAGEYYLLSDVVLVKE